jgi:NADP-dependent 3-hydroxy acid dehydrogenase YdfG
MQKTIFITGATSGIGYACAWQMAANEHRLILTGRRADRLEKLKAELQSKFNSEILVLPFDVTNLKAVTQAIESIPEAFSDIDILINNAGLAVGLNKIHEGVIDDWERMIDTNLKGLLYVTRLISPKMVARKQGHIINIGSIAGKETYVNGNVYCATKFGVDALTKSMRIDLVEYGIKVTQIAPGAVETEFSNVRFKGDDARADKVYDGFEPLRPEDIADAIYYCINLPSHVTINDLTIMPTAQAAASLIYRQ